MRIVRAGSAGGRRVLGFFDPTSRSRDDVVRR